MRRYRVFIIFAVIAIGALYHFTSLGDLESAGAASVEGLKNFGQKVESSVPPTANQPNIKDASEPKNPNAPIAAPSLADSGAPEQSQAPAIVKKPEEPSRHNQASLSAEKSDVSVKSSVIAKPSANNDQDVVNPKATPAGKPALPIGSISTTTTSKPPTGPADPITGGGGGRLEIIADTSIPKIHWSQMPEHFPVPTELLIHLPTGAPKAIPKIQHQFAEETGEEKADREQKRDAIKKAFSFSWSGYRQKAWMQDELSPVSGKYRNPFCAWGATLVDTLDTLYIMGLKDEFEEAVETVKDIDFTTSPRNDIPLFETVIRYLGGLIAAYDISDGAHRVLLDKAVELADILMGAFDTPNRMPMTFYLWKPTFASQPHRAKTRVVLAELGSLSVEFTRLAQITKEDKYYDAIARITNEFEIWQNNTRIPGLWPQVVDASGCKKPDVSQQITHEHSATNGATDSTPLDIQDSEDTKTLKVSEGSSAKELINEEVGTSNLNGRNASIETSKTAAQSAKFSPAVERRAAPASPAVTNLNGAISKMEINERTGSDLQQLTTSKHPECEPQGLASPPFSTSEVFGIGGQADSTYEYLPKEYMLLGGLEDQYRTIYEAAADVITKELLYRAMIPDNERRILHPGLGQISDTKGVTLKPEGSHLGCFAGGMYAVGAKIFAREGDMKIAKELTDGCVWAYESTTTGIMPDAFLAVPCPTEADCLWNETYYHEKLDPYVDSRERTRLAQLAEQQVVLSAGKESEKTSSAVEPASISLTPEKVESQPTQPKADGVVAPAQSKVDGTVQQSIEDTVGKPESPAAEQSADQPVSLPAGGADTEQPVSPPRSDAAPAKSRVKRQLGDITPPAADTPIDAVGNSPTATPPVESTKDATTTPLVEASEEVAADKITTGAPPTIMEQYNRPPSRHSNGTMNLHRIPTHEEFVKGRIRDERLPKGMTKVTGPRYLLR